MVWMVNKRWPLMWKRWRIRIRSLECEFLGVVNDPDFSYCGATMCERCFILAFWWTMEDLKVKAWDSRRWLEDWGEGYKNILSWGIRLEEVYLAGEGREDDWFLPWLWVLYCCWRWLPYINGSDNLPSPKFRMFPPMAYHHGCLSNLFWTICWGSILVKSRIYWIKIEPDEERTTLTSFATPRQCPQWCTALLDDNQ